MNKTYRRVCFTLHDYTIFDCAKLENLFHNGTVKYIVYGREVCPTTAKPHLQGFANFVKPTKFNTIKLALGSTAHVEAARGDDASNRSYCIKDGASVELGTPSTQGKRNDLELAAKQLAEHGSLKRVAEEHPASFIRYHRGFRAYLTLVRPVVDRCEKTALRVYVGYPGVGKSRAAAEGAREFCKELYNHDQLGGGGGPDAGGSGERSGSEEAAQSDSFGSLVYYKPRGEWWDGYQQQPVVIIDDFYGWMKYDELLKISDRYPYRVPVKGAFETFNSKLIYITSNALIVDWYKFPNFDPTALYRRCTEYCFIEKDGTHKPVDVVINF
jgi:hypothetical protein